MDSCVARRTRSRTEQHLITLLRRSKGIVDDVPGQAEEEGEKKDGKEKKTRRVFRNADHRPKLRPLKRRRRTATVSGVSPLGRAREAGGGIVHLDVDEDGEHVSVDSLGLNAGAVNSKGLGPHEVNATKTNVDSGERFDHDKCIVIDDEDDNGERLEPDELSAYLEEGKSGSKKNEWDINNGVPICIEDDDDDDNDIEEEDDDDDESDASNDDESDASYDEDADETDASSDDDESDASNNDDVYSSDSKYERGPYDDGSSDENEGFDGQEEVNARVRRGRESQNTKCLPEKEGKMKNVDYWNKRKQKDPGVDREGKKKNLDHWNKRKQKDSGVDREGKKKNLDHWNKRKQKDPGVDREGKKKNLDHWNKRKQKDPGVDRERKKKNLDHWNKRKQKDPGVDREGKKKNLDHWNERKLKDRDVFRLLFNSVWERGETRTDLILPSDTTSRQEEEGSFEERAPLEYKFGYEEPKPVEKSEAEKELDQLWDEMEFALMSSNIGSVASLETGNKVMDSSSKLCRQGEHNLVLDEEIGWKCRYCGFVAAEIKYISPTVDTNHSERMSRRTGAKDEDGSTIHGLNIVDGLGSGQIFGSANFSEGSVWDLVPGIKSTLYPHQQEGFEFIWKNIAGTIEVNILKSFSLASKTGGCIISHSPGTGKTRLAIVFLQSYLKLFPCCRPVIIAPASLLLTWEEEFKKWNVGIPFHNLNNLEFSGTESKLAISALEKDRYSRRSQNAIRMVKLCSWSEQESVLGVSYTLYEKLAAGNDGGKGKSIVGAKDHKERQEMGKILLEIPGLLVLDEGHTPRNSRSCIWKVLSRVKTRNRIILSGTPFQNNFKELSNILCLTRPEYAHVFTSRFKKFSEWRLRNEAGFQEEQAKIEEIKGLMAPFVHLHKGNILQRSLKGLRDSAVVLNPPVLQTKVLKSIKRSQNTFELEHQLSVVSVHPSLLLSCSGKAKSNLDNALLEKLERIRLDPAEGVKAKFLLEFIRLSEAMKEKVLVFSQYIDTLLLVSELLNSLFGWSQGKEIFYIHGGVGSKQRQYLINNFNDPNSEAKVLLASTRTCSEGINLVGASRVVLLDVVWNPSVERQAISRAYRLGQKRVVYTYRLLVKGTPECDKYCRQANKDRLSELVFASATEKDKQISSGKAFEDRILDEMVRHERLKDIFKEIIHQPKESNLIATFSSFASD